jgi:hypothetical protein
MGNLHTDPKTGLRKHTYPTHKQISAKYGVNLSYLQDKSCAEFWGQRRKALKAKLHNRFVDWKLGAFISESAQVDALTVDKIKKIHQVMDLYLEQALNPLETTNEQGDTKVEFNVTPNELQSIVTTLEKCQKLMRLSNNEPVDAASVAKELKKALLQDYEKPTNTYGKNENSYGYGKNQSSIPIGVQQEIDQKLKSVYGDIIDIEHTTVEDQNQTLSTLQKKEKNLDKVMKKIEEEIEELKKDP